ncbi:MAG: MIP family channel protein [Bacteroidaceae bacterium]|nr:MIP family channel protein [Bacteroidaceae bacterium]MBQ8937057.1 MIP family channel protein [Bacteroidaceae bacterium]MBR1665911.1 MIP family channel protein [Bacteroidaceae bacterium]
MKKYLAEMVGTMVLVLMGCGTAVSLNCGVDPASVIGTAIAFGLAVVAMAYTIGGISGCHINPAITLGCFLTKRIDAKDCAMYMLFQVIGAFIGSALLYALVATAPGLAEGTTTGANACAAGQTNGLIAEIILTCVFVLVVLGTTDAKKGAGNFAGLAIGLSLILIHLVGIHYTGTSVNPARSIAPAVFQGGQALSDLWVFIVGPFVGAICAAGIWSCIGGCDKCEK